MAAMAVGWAVLVGAEEAAVAVPVEGGTVQEGWGWGAEGARVVPGARVGMAEAEEGTARAVWDGGAEEDRGWAVGEAPVPGSEGEEASSRVPMSSPEGRTSTSGRLAEAT